MRDSRKLIAGLLLLLVATAARAHTLFIKPESFFFPPSRQVSIPLLNGTFVHSESKVITRRMSDVAIIGPNGERSMPQATDWRHDGDVTILDTVFGAPGNYVVGVGTKPTKTHIAPDNFNDYLVYEGLSDDARERGTLQETALGAAERYSKFAKAILQVGSTRTDSYATVLGYPVEIVPLENPYEAKPGSMFRARILKDGQPLADELVFATHEGFYDLSPEGRYEELVTLRSDQDGIIQFQLTDAGRWYVRFIHLTRLGDAEYWYSKLLVWLGVEDPRIPYESLWATLTFEVR